MYLLRRLHPLPGVSLRDFLHHYDHRRATSSQTLSNESISRSGIHAALSGTDPVDIARAMGGSSEPPEEPLLASPEDGYGYYPSAIIGNGIKQYAFLRKVLVLIGLWSPLTSRLAWMVRSFNRLARLASLSTGPYDPIH